MKAERHLAWPLIPGPPHACPSLVVTPWGACLWAGTAPGAMKGKRNPHSEIVLRGKIDLRDTRLYVTNPKRNRDLCGLGNRGRLLGSGPEGQVRYGPMGKSRESFQFERIKADTLFSTCSAPDINS